MRKRVLVVLAGTVLLAGCVTDGPLFTSPLRDTRMPVDVDLRARPVLNPPVQHQQGKVDPVDTRPDREWNYGPETRLQPRTERNDLLAALDRFRAREPRGGSTMLGLARRKRPQPAGVADADNDEEQDARLDPDAVKDTDGGYRLNFEDADVKDVLHAVLGNVLGLSYSVAPSVSGHITIASSAPQNRSELLSTLESALALQGLSMTRMGASYRIAPLTIGGGTVDRTGRQPGFGISVVPLEYSSAASVMKLLSGFITDADGVRIDTSQNAVIIRGPQPRREEIVRAVKNFDADWMHTQSVSVVELRRSHPDEIISELNQVFDVDTDGTGAGNGTAAGPTPAPAPAFGANPNSGSAPSNPVIQFKPIKRMRAIMVISRNPQLLRRATNWIRRLDHQDTSATSSIYVYRPRYRDARELSRLVNGLFGTGSKGDTGGGGVSFANTSTTPGQSGSPGGTSSLGASSASFAGSLTGGGQNGAAPAGLGSTLGTSGGSFGGGGSNGSSFGGGTGGGSTGTQGGLADPIEAGQGNGGQQRSNLSLTADTSNNTIVAYTDGETYAKVQAVLRQLDVPPVQVAINVIVAEVTLNDALQYGVQAYFNNKAGSFGLVGTPTTVVQQGAANLVPGFQTTTNNIGLAAGQGLNIFAGNTASATVVLQALDTISKVHVLSTPSIVVMENKPGTFEVGNEVPILAQQATSTLTSTAQTVNSVNYIDTGIILKIIPRVGQKGDVTMDLDQEISAVVPDAASTQSTTGNLTPTISKRRIASAITVKSGGSVMLAGLIQDTRQQTRAQIPFIGSTLGSIFGNTSNQFARTELVIFIRPVIIRNGKDAQHYAEDERPTFKAMNIHAGDGTPGDGTLTSGPVYKP